MAKRTTTPSQGPESEATKTRRRAATATTASTEKARNGGIAAPKSPPTPPRARAAARPRTDEAASRTRPPRSRAAAGSPPRSPLEAYRVPAEGREARDARAHPIEQRADEAPDELLDLPPDETAADEIDADLRHRMISEAAYHHYRERGYEDGYDVDDWLQAEAEIDQMLQSRAR